VQDLLLGLVPCDREVDMCPRKLRGRLIRRRNADNLYRSAHRALFCQWTEAHRLGILNLFGNWRGDGR
jgi:hypothetical protein